MVKEITKTKETKVEVLMSVDKAKVLTDDIKSTTSALYVLLKQAHDSKAWVVLGYKSWSEYVEEEFDFSRARSYQLINQANVIEEINEASGVPVYITERQARAIKKRLPEITEKLKEEVKDKDLDQKEAEEKAKEILDGREEQPEMNDIDNANSNEIDKANEVQEKTQSEPEEEPEEYYPINDNNIKKEPLSDDDEFLYENLKVTFQIFNSFPEASDFGKIIKRSDIDKRELKRKAEIAFSWITKFIDEIE